MRNDIYPKLPYTISDFRAYLKSLNGPGDTAGYARIANACPAACWLRNKLQKPVRVSNCIIVIDTIIGYEVPRWLIRFQEKVDKWPKGESIGRRQALNLLSRAERETDYSA